MKTDEQVKGLLKSMSSGKQLSFSAKENGMSPNTARKYLKSGDLPSTSNNSHLWLTRNNPFETDWPVIEDLLETNSGLEAKQIFWWLQQEYEGRYQDGQLRTLQRHIRFWRINKGSSKEVFFPQIHYPGRMCQSDYTSMNGLGVTIHGAQFDHLLYHFVLTYSNWEDCTICFSESFESLSEGLQNALWRLGCVPKKHQTDRLSAAVSNLTEKKEFTQKYQAVLSHYKLEGCKTNPSSPNENGDVEQSNNRLKKAIDQMLMLRGSRDFESRLDYEAFLRKLIIQLNAGRLKLLKEELKCSHVLPQKRIDACTKYKDIRVSKNSIIRVNHNVYSVHSRLIGIKVDVKSYMSHIEIWYSNKHLFDLPKLYGENRHKIDYRHIIDSLIKKPGAFENYKYRDDLFPTSRFRIVYDYFCEQSPSKASKGYLQILYLAAYEGEERVDSVLKELINAQASITKSLVKSMVRMRSEVPVMKEPQIKAIDLSDYDSLFSYNERCVNNGK
jgi:hypothetical protein